MRAALADLEPGERVVVAVSGGPDSLALAAAAAAEAPRGGWQPAAVVVDHGLQPGSAAMAAAGREAATALGLDPVEVVRVTVPAGPGTGGPEAAARAARHRALRDTAASIGAPVILLGHTRDDQAETVLLGLARGSGTRSLAGMAVVAGPLRRPLLGLPRDVVRAAAAETGLPFVVDPHNADPAYARARVRHDVLPALAAGLGPGVLAGLARTAALCRDDADALDAWAAAVWERAAVAVDGRVELAVDVVAGEPVAVRTRVWRRAALAAGAAASALTRDHVLALDRYARGADVGPPALPGGVPAERRCGRLSLGRGAAADADRSVR